MDNLSKIAVVGAGPAGSSLAIRLALLGFETVLIEKEKFPREKLCGEFISPECLTHFEQLGVLDSMLASGGDHIFETRFYETGGRSVSVPSEWFGKPDSFALSLSRAEMDLKLLERAREVGVDVREGTTILNIEIDDERVRRLVGRSDDGLSMSLDADLFIDATGRAGTLGRLAQDKSSPKPPKPTIVGFKSHVTGVDLGKGSCEIYSFPGGYAGLSNVENDRANLCFLVKSDVVRSMGSDASAIVNEVVRQNCRAAVTLQEFSAGEWLAVSISGFGTKRLAAAPNLFSIGDAAAFIDPFTGSGMVMAMQSAGILAGAIDRCRATPELLPSEYAAGYRRSFARRLRVCSLLRRTAFMPRLATAVVASLGISSAARRLLARSTRG
jgi:flavin-dependent dehydrogenase